MSVPETMSGVVLTGHGGPEKLEWRADLPTPRPGEGEVLIRVSASSVNNTDVNTRIGWYSKAVRGDTASTAGGDENPNDEDSGWSGVPMAFPRIQGADCCGVIVAAGEGVAKSRIGERVIVRALQAADAGPFGVATFGSEYDGGFAQYAKTASRNALAVKSDWTDVELASIPCAYSTAEGMIQRVALRDERVLITGASGGVGSAAVQLAKRRGAHVTAVVRADKADALLALGADETIDRDGPLPKGAYSVVIDLVAGPRWPDLIDALERGGRYVVAGAIAGPIVELDVRTLYLNDLSFFGCTYQPDAVMEDLVRYVEADEIRPNVAAQYPLAEIAAAQEAFLAKSFVGKIGLVIS